MAEPALVPVAPPPPWPALTGKIAPLGGLRFVFIVRTCGRVFVLVHAGLHDLAPALSTFVPGGDDPVQQPWRWYLRRRVGADASFLDLAVQPDTTAGRGALPVIVAMSAPLTDPADQLWGIVVAQDIADLIFMTYVLPEKYSNRIEGVSAYPVLCALVDSDLSQGAVDSERLLATHFHIARPSARGAPSAAPVPDSAPVLSP